MSGILKDINKDSISKIVKQQRVLLDLTQAELAKKAGVSTTSISRLERGERYPSARTLPKLAKALGMNKIELFIHANYLSKPVSTKEMEEVTQIIKLDPKVLFELSKEPLKTQRAVLAILKMLKSLATDIDSENDKDSL